MDKVRELLQLTKEGNEEAREKLILDNVGLIWSVVRRFTNRGYESDDLFQIGSIGLMKAVDKFDLSYDVKFSTYAVPMITGEIRRFIRDDGMIKVSRTLKENAYKIMKAREMFCQTYQREATIDEISSITQIAREEIDHVLLHQAMKHLEERERQIIQYRYFDGKTQQEIAGLFHISQVQVSRMEKKILKKLKRQMVGKF